jgi:hypothetical protein
MKASMDLAAKRMRYTFYHPKVCRARGAVATIEILIDKGGARLRIKTYFDVREISHNDILVCNGTGSVVHSSCGRLEN